MEGLAGIVAEEDADTGCVFDPEAVAPEIVGLGAPFDLVPGKRYPVVVVEIAGARGQPVEGPAHPRLECEQLLQGRPRYSDQRSVTRGEMGDHVIESVRPERAALAAFVPVGREHEMLDH